MRLGILSDAHGNLEGFKRCYEFLLAQQVDQIYFLGDAIGYMPEGLPILDLLQASDVTCLLGNHEAMLLGHLPLPAANEEVYRLKQFCREITQEQLHYISAWVPFQRCIFDQKRILFTHGSPWNPVNGYVYPDFDFQKFDALPCDMIIMGHTHRPFIFKRENKTIINVGSCGLPRDRGGLLSCVVLDTETNQGEIIRLPLDVEEVVSKFEKAVHPQVIELFRR